MRKFFAIVAAGGLLVVGVMVVGGVADAATASVTDTAFTYTGSGWQVDTPSEHYSGTTGDSASINFTAGTGGSTVTLKGDSNGANGTVSVSIDGGAAVTANEHGSAGYGAVVFTSPLLTAGGHTMKVTVATPFGSVEGSGLSNGTYGGAGYVPGGSTAATPTAAFSASTLTVAFDASATTAPAGSVASYAWDFGDATTGTGKTVSHTYAAAGTYTVKMTATDNVGGKTTTSESVTVAKPATSTAGTTPAPTPPPTGTVSKIAVVMEENHSAAEMQSGMPYLNGLAKKYGYASNYTANDHPSLPNYLDITGGSNFGYLDDNAPSADPVSGSSVFGQSLAAGQTARTYAQTMPSNCAKGDSGAYAVHHNPWAYFTGESTACQTGDVSDASFTTDAAANKLPTVSMLVPDLNNDAHDGTLAQADSYLQAKLPSVLNSTDFTSGALAVVVVADEDDNTAGNNVFAAVLQSSLAAKTVTTALNHLSLSKMLSKVSGSPALANASGASDMAAAFGLTVGPATAPAPTGTAAAALNWGTAISGDEFNGTAVDTTKWGLYSGAGNSGNGTRSPSQITEGGGFLTIAGNASDATGGMSWTGTPGTKYGRYEMRMKASATGASNGGAQYHPVLIQWPDSDLWPSGGEYDYAETDIGVPTMDAYMHHPDGSQDFYQTTVDFTQWHNYAFEWEPSGLTGWIDGVQWFHDTNASAQAPGPMHQTIQLDSNNPGTEQPAQMQVDWYHSYTP